MARIGAFTLKGAPWTDTIRTLIPNVKTRPVAAGCEASEDCEILSLAVSPDVPGPARLVRAVVSRNTEDSPGIIRKDPGCPECREGPSCRRSGVAPRARRFARQEPERAK